MAKNEVFTASRRSVLRGGAVAGGLMLGSGLGASASGLTAAHASASGGGSVKPAEEIIETEYFLKIDGIAGESQDATHKGWIEVASYGVHATNATKPTAKAKGKVSFNPMVITKPVDTSSPTLFLACAAGKHFTKATLSMRASNGKTDYLTVSLTGVLISSYSQNAADAATPTEQFSLNFTKIEMKYTQQSV
jgi:type VI secretion system secreted protein Hcp